MVETANTTSATEQQVPEAKEVVTESFKEPIAESFKFKRNWTLWEHYDKSNSNKNDYES